MSKRNIDQEHWPKRKPGAQPGNQNCKGHRNAAGSHAGAPRRNRNAEKDGGYSTIYFDELSDADKELFEKLPSGSRESLVHEMKVLKFREYRILSKIAEYEAVPDESLYVSGAMSGKNDMVSQDSAFVRILKLQEALQKVHGRIVKVADSLRAMDEFERRLALERDRLEIARMRVTGAVQVDDDTVSPDADDPLDPESVE